MTLALESENKKGETTLMESEGICIIRNTRTSQIFIGLLGNYNYEIERNRHVVLMVNKYYYFSPRILISQS